MKQFIITLFFVLVATVFPMSNAVAAGAAVELEDADVDLNNKQSLQRGAKYFVNYCMGCHSLKFSRYNRMARDIGLSDDQVEANLIFTMNDKGEPTEVAALMENAMQEENAANWFGQAPPDLSLVARSRGADWIYSFLKAFYADPSRPLGVNNTVFANTGMPHVLWELQGMQHLEEHDDGNGHKTQELVLEEPGKATPTEYDQIVRDITAFLVYVGEPAKLHRKTIGVWVLLFLAVFFVVAYFLKKEYWKDVH